jgi:hypothetical protein
MEHIRGIRKGDIVHVYALKIKLPRKVLLIMEYEFCYYFDHQLCFRKQLI